MRRHWISVLLALGAVAACDSGDPAISLSSTASDPAPAATTPATITAATTPGSTGPGTATSAAPAESTVTTAASTAPNATTAPAPEHFATLPVGAALPSGAQCAEWVRPVEELRPDNAEANQTRGTRPNTRTDWVGFARVDGDFVGTTDEIIQWAACKWGIDEDIARAQIVKESAWHHSVNGDNGESFGLGQVRCTYHPEACVDDNAINSSAYNLDYTYAVWRGCYEGVYTWLNEAERGQDYAAGDEWGCLGVWFSGRWYTDQAIAYVEGGDTLGYGNVGVREHFEARTWESSDFANW